MKEPKLYQCEICGTKYNDKKKAVECEKWHTKPASFGAAKYRPCTESDRLPDWVEIIFDDGRTVRYRR